MYFLQGKDLNDVIMVNQFLKNPQYLKVIINSFSNIFHNS